VQAAVVVAVRQDSPDACGSKSRDRFAEPRVGRRRSGGGLPLAERIDGCRYTDGYDADDDERGEPRAHFTLIVRADANVEMVVVVPEDLHDAGRSRQARVRADVDEVGAGSDEEIYEGLGKGPVDLLGALGRSFSPIEARVVNVRVEAVLMSRMLGPERPAVPTAEVADPDARRIRVSAGESRDDAEDGANEIVRTPSPPRAVRRHVKDGIPSEEELACGREPHAVSQPPRTGRAEADRLPPHNLSGV
jgi:hypothetical protein